MRLENIWIRFNELCEEKKEDVPPSFKSRLSTFKQKLTESIGDLYFFYQPWNRDIHERGMLLIPKNYLYEIFIANDKENIPDAPVTFNESDVMTIVHAGLLIRKNLSEHPTYAGLNVSKELAKSVVPQNLHLLLSFIAKGQEAVDDFFNEKSDVNDHEYYYDNTDNTELDSDDDSDSEEEEEESITIGRENESKCFIPIYSYCRVSSKIVHLLKFNQTAFLLLNISIFLTNNNKIFITFNGLFLSNIYRSQQSNLINRIGYRLCQ